MYVGRYSKPIFTPLGKIHAVLILTIGHVKNGKKKPERSPPQVGGSKSSNL
jgi:hypothetical protein